MGNRSLLETQREVTESENRSPNLGLLSAETWSPVRPCQMRNESWQSQLAHAEASRLLAGENLTEETCNSWCLDGLAMRFPPSKDQTITDPSLDLAATYDKSDEMSRIDRLTHRPSGDWPRSKFSLCDRLPHLQSTFRPEGAATESSPTHRISVEGGSVRVAKGIKSRRPEGNNHHSRCFLVPRIAWLIFAHCRNSKRGDCTKRRKVANLRRPA